MEFGESMVSGLFENISPNEDKNSSLWRSITGLDDLKVYAILYNSSSNYEVVGGAVTFGVNYSPEFVLKILGDERKHHEVLCAIYKPTHTHTCTSYKDIY